MFTNEVQWSSLHVEEQPFVEYGNSVELGANPSCISLLLVVGHLETCLGHNPLRIYTEFTEKVGGLC
jgi:hypothetical protein